MRRKEEKMREIIERREEGRERERGREGGKGGKHPQKQTQSTQDVPLLLVNRPCC